MKRARLDYGKILISKDQEETLRVKVKEMLDYDKAGAERINNLLKTTKTYDHSLSAIFGFLKARKERGSSLVGPLLAYDEATDSLKMAAGFTAIGRELNQCREKIIITDLPRSALLREGLPLLPRIRDYASNKDSPFSAAVVNTSLALNSFHGKDQGAKGFFFFSPSRKILARLEGLAVASATKAFGLDIGVTGANGILKDVYLYQEKSPSFEDFQRLRELPVLLMTQVEDLPKGKNFLDNVLLPLLSARQKGKRLTFLYSSLGPEDLAWALEFHKDEKDKLLNGLLGVAQPFEVKDLAI